MAGVPDDREAAIIERVAEVICNSDAQRESEEGCGNPEWWSSFNDDSPVREEYRYNARAVVAAFDVAARGVRVPDERKD